MVDNPKCFFAYPYDGTNSRMLKEPYCISCHPYNHETEYDGKPRSTMRNAVDNNKSSSEGTTAASSAVLRCSRCKLVYYCSRECQLAHFSKHKRLCKQIDKRQGSVEKLEQELRRLRGGRFVLIDNENFVANKVAVDYIKVRADLAEQILFDIAWDYEVEPVWKAVVYHYQEMMRLNCPDNMGLRYRFPFLLLYLNRDDDAYGFCRYWYEVEGGRRDTEESHRLSQQGDWLYGYEKDCRILDFMKENRPGNPKSVSVHTLVVLAVIKMRLVAAQESRRQQAHVFCHETAAGETLAPVHAVVKEMCQGNLEWQTSMAQQMTQLQGILDEIDRKNATVLPAILNPEALLSQPDPRLYCPGHPSDAYKVVKHAHRLWNRIPGATELLTRRCGPRPTYNCNLKTWDLNFASDE